MTPGRWRRLAPAAAGELVLAGFFALEPRLRQGPQARSLDAAAADAGTTRGVLVATLAAGTLTPVLATFRRGRLPTQLGWSGVALMVGGLAVRVWAARALGHQYTRTLQLSADQQLLESGPYARVRHPGYAGVLALWVGYGLSWTSWPAVLWSSSTTLPAYLRRIGVEEALLEQRFGDAYVRYRARTAALLPAVY